MEYLARLVRCISLDRSGIEKGIVYCLSRQVYERVADEMGMGMYYSSMIEDECRMAWEAWTSGGGSRQIAATSGLRIGIDIQGIVAVIYMGVLYGIVDFMQQMGQGGRHNSEVVESVIIYSGLICKGKGVDIIVSINVAWMEEFMHMDGYR